jgi:hypothetical protein
MLPAALRDNHGGWSLSVFDRAIARPPACAMTVLDGSSVVIARSAATKQSSDVALLSGCDPAAQKQGHWIASLRSQ